MALELQNWFDLRDIPGDFSRKSKPARIPIMAQHVFEETLIEICRIFGQTHSAIEINVIRVDMKQRHPTMGCYPIQSFCPDIRRLFIEQRKECGILRQRVWQLPIAFGAIPLNPERENCLNTIRLGFKGIGIERGATKARALPIPEVAPVMTMTFFLQDLSFMI